MKKLTLLSVLTATMLTTTSANFSFMGDMMKDMREAAKDMKTEATDGMKEIKDEGIDAVKDMKDDVNSTASKAVDNSKELKR